MSKKDFHSIENDYQFFMKSATEAEQDLAEHLNELKRLAIPDGELSLLDFGCGQGDFSEALLSALQLPPERLRLSLLEPVAEHRQQASARLADYCQPPITEFPLLEELGATSFDFILANHSGYYVKSAKEVVAGFASKLKPSGIAILAIAGFENFLLQLWQVGFNSIGRKVPYWTAEDYVEECAQAGISLRSKQVPYQLRFVDSSENRDKILRFLFGEFWPLIDHDLLRAEFQPFAVDDHIIVDTSSRHLVLES